MAKLHFLYSVMNAGKSTHLLQVRHNYLANGGNVLVFTSVIDDRSGIGKVSSRIGLETDATAIGENDDLFDRVSREHARQSVTAVLIDEVQFLTPAHIWQAAGIVDRLKIPVMAYGLKNNAFGELFNQTICTLLAIATKSEEIKQVCHCNEKAIMILRYDQNGNCIRSGNVIEVGGDDRYVSVCRSCWVDGNIGPARKEQIRQSDTPPHK